MRAIDADALMEAINTWPKFGVDERCRIVPWDEGYEPYIHLRDAVIAITGMPTIEERKKGEWIEILSSNHTYKCSVCGRFLVNITDGKNKVAKNYPFCHCGADMRNK